MCMIKSASILNIGPYQTGFFKGTSLAIKLQVMNGNTLKSVFDSRNIPLQRQGECTVFFMVALDFKHRNLSHTKFSL